MRAEDMGLRMIMEQLGNRHPTFVSAYNKALESAKRASPRDYNPASRLLFFRLLQDGDLDWSNRASWEEKAKQIEALPRRGRFKVENGVIKVQFGTKKPNCEDGLD
jgi:hypothetical protein